MSDLCVIEGARRRAESAAAGVGEGCKAGPYNKVVLTDANPGRAWRRWTESELEILRSPITIEDAAAQLGRSVQAVYHRRMQIGLVTTPNKKLQVGPHAWLKAAREESERSGLALRDIVGPCRARPFVRARWRLFKHFRDKGASLPAIARAAGVDHTTVYWGLKRMAAD